MAELEEEPPTKRLRMDDETLNLPVRVEAVGNDESQRIHTVKFQAELKAGLDLVEARGPKNRTTRNSRGESLGPKTAAVRFASIKVRPWQKRLVKLGSMVIPQWVPLGEKNPEFSMVNSKFATKKTAAGKTRGKKHMKLLASYEGRTSYSVLDATIPASSGGDADQADDANDDHNEQE